MFSFYRPALPELCSCGKMHDEECPLIGFANHNHFPPFAELPNIHQLDEEYYIEERVGVYRPKRHWGVVGEIKETCFFIRPRAEIKTKYGETLKVNFHLEGASEPNCFSWSDLKVGNTMVILYAESKVFLDGECGIRQESPVTCMVFPVPLLELTNEYELLLTRLSPPNKACFNCGKPEPEGENLLKCSRCKSALYCNKVCQSQHWKTVHKTLCPSASKLVKLTSVNFDRFERYLTWDFQEPVSLMDTATIGKKMVELISKLVDGVPNNSDTNIGPFEVKNFKNSFILSSLKLFRNSVAKESSTRHHVIDLDGKPSFENDTALLAIAYWQRRLGIAVIDWVFETDGPTPSIVLAMMEMFHEFDTKIIDEGTYLICHAPSESLMYSYSFDFVAFGALALARNRPDRMLIRVLQAPCVSAASSLITAAATMQRPPNVFDLWIRRACRPLSSFRPVDAKKTLVEQLLDIASVPGGEDSSDEERDQSEDVRCAVCRRGKASSSFSKKQLRKNPSKRRCKSCIQADRPCI
jgi:hypothetical protein